MVHISSESPEIVLDCTTPTLKGLGGFQNKKSRPQLPSFLSKNGDFKTRDFSRLIKRVSTGVLLLELEPTILKRSLF